MWCSEGQAGRQDRQSQSSLLTVEAMLRMLRIKESKQRSALSDEADIGSDRCLDWAGSLMCCRTPWPSSG